MTSPSSIEATSAPHHHQLGTFHREYILMVHEGLDAIPEVTHHLETYDVTTVRASMPTYLLRCKMVLSGKVAMNPRGYDLTLFTSRHPVPSRLSLLLRCSR